MDVNLVLFKNDGSQASFSLPDGVAVLGRSHDCELRIPLKVVSRKHCQLSPNQQSLKIQDLDSRGGTFVNGKRINAASLKAGDYIRIGPLTFLVQIDGKPNEIVPPKPVKAAPAAKKPAAPKPPSEDAADSFLEPDASDSFLAELDEL
ncbi:MAG TPA: FHA domain-containing protein [Phycisphaerales bacterium]|nr:FHA domain-containing protein [Phycisphaerales bacterium]